MIDDYLENEYGGERDPYHKREVGVYHASMSGKCVRRLYFDFVEDAMPGASAWPHFELGHRIESVVQTALEDQHGPHRVKQDIPIKIESNDLDWILVGRTDPVVLDDNLEIDTLWEVKSTKNISYVSDEPKPEHVHQVHCYMTGLEQFDAKIIYVSKYDLEYVIHEIEYDPAIASDIMDKMDTLHESLMNEEPPEPSPYVSDHDYFCEHDGKCCKDVVDEIIDDT